MFPYRFYFNRIIISIFIVLCGGELCAQQVYVKTLSELKQASKLKNASIYIHENINLLGEQLFRSNNIKLILQSTLYNGLIIGDNTIIESEKEGRFEDIDFKGSFIGRPKIEWFGLVCSQIYDNSAKLNRALQLTHLSSVKELILPKNKLIYVKSDFSDTQWRDFLRVGSVEIKSGVTLDLNGSTIRCIPNSSHQYNILFSRNSSDIVIKNGKIQGDRAQHFGTHGEWGYGIELQGVKNFIIDSIECFDCWGDGIDIQVSSDGDGNKESIKTKDGHCSNGTVINVYCYNNRRQGMSIQGILGLDVIDSRFSCSNGTNPQCGVDIEPYSHNNVVSNIFFERCQFDGNVNSGLILTGSSISDIKVSNCLFWKNSGWDLSLQGTNIMISNCDAPTGYNKPTIRVVGDCNNLTIQDSELQSVFAQGFSLNQSVYNAIINNCSFSWGNTFQTFGFSDDKSLKLCNLTYENCVFDFSSGTFGDGNMVYHSDNKNYKYLYKHCVFNVGNRRLRITNTQLFYDCDFNDCSDLLFIGNPHVDNQLILRRCVVRGLSSNSYINVYSSEDGISLKSDLRGTSFSNSLNSDNSNRFVFSSARGGVIQVRGIKKEYHKRIVSPSSNIQIIR